MANLKAMLATTLLMGSPSLAAERTIRISCHHTSQAGFGRAVALMKRKPADAHRMFEEMWRGDQDCAILFWGMAMSAANPEERQDDGYTPVTAVIAG